MVKKGFILVTLSWVILIAALLAVSQLRDAELRLRGTRQADQEAQLRNAALSSLALIRAALGKDSELEFDAPSEGWGWRILADQYSQEFEEDFPGISIHVQIHDDDSRVPPTSDHEQRLAMLLEELGHEPLQARKSAFDLNEVLWTDRDPPATANEKHEVPRLRLRRLVGNNAIRGISLYGEDLDFDGELDKNERDRNLSHPPDNGDGLLDPGLEEFLTLSGSGVCNLNMVSREVLLTIPGINEAIAKEILAFRAGPDSIEGTRDDGVFETVDSILDLSSVSRFREFTLGRANSYLRTSTERFDVRIAAQSEDGMLFRIQTILLRTDEGVQVVCWKEDYGF